MDWEKFSKEIGGTYKKGGFIDSPKIQVRVGALNITLTIANHEFQMNAPYHSKDGFHFVVMSSKNITSPVHGLTLHIVEIGDPAFDRAFIVKGSDSAKAKALFSNPKIKQGLSSVGAILLATSDDRVYARFFYEKSGDQLKALVELLAEILNQLISTGSASENNPNVYR